MNQQLLRRTPMQQQAQEPPLQRQTSHVFVVVPAYNEADNLPRMLGEVHHVLADARETCRLVVVDDGSRDATAEVARHLSAQLPIHLLQHPHNRGVGAVFHTGLTAVCAQAQPEDIIVIMEADGTNDPRVLPAMLERIRQGDDVVIGSRYRSGGGYSKFPLRRLGLSLGANGLMRLLFPIAGVRDYTIFFRAYRAGLLQRGFEQYEGRLIERRTFACNAEILIKLQSLQPRVSEVPMLYRYDLKQGRSKLAIRRTVAEYLRLMVAMWKTQRRIRRLTAVKAALP